MSNGCSLHIESASTLILDFETSITRSNKISVAYKLPSLRCFYSSANRVIQATNEKLKNSTGL